MQTSDTQKKLILWEQDLEYGTQVMTCLRIRGLNSQERKIKYKYKKCVKI